VKRNTGILFIVLAALLCVVLLMQMYNALAAILRPQFADLMLTRAFRMLVTLCMIILLFKRGLARIKEGQRETDSNILDEDVRD
jgi:drug/metabolite transporter (DMT)-like permease